MSLNLGDPIKSLETLKEAFGLKLSPPIERQLDAYHRIVGKIIPAATATRVAAQHAVGEAKRDSLAKHQHRGETLITPKASMPTDVLTCPPRTPLT